MQQGGDESRCEQQREPTQRPIRAEAASECLVFDPLLLIERHKASWRESGEFPEELRGVPFN